MLKVIKLTKEDIISTLKIFKDSSLPSETLEKVWVAGGAALTLMDEHLGNSTDIDLFFETKESFNEFLDYFGYSFFRNVYNSEFASTFEIDGVSVQLIHRSFKKIEEILDEFDLKNVKLAFNINNGAVIDKRNGAKELLEINNFKHCSLLRIIKYINNGYKVTLEDFRLIVDAHVSGELMSLYDGEISTQDEIREFLSTHLKKPEHIKLLLNLFPEGDWILDALFYNKRACLYPFNMEFKEFLVNEKQRLTFKLLNVKNKNEYDDTIKTIKNIYPEYFINDKRHFL